VSSRAPITIDPKAGSDFLGAAGLVLSLVAWSHATLILIPPHFGVAPWEFAAATQTIDVFPLAVTGMAMLAFAAINRAWNKRNVALVVMCALSALLMIGVAGLILLDLLVAWNSVTSGMRENLTKTAAKALLFAFTFTVFFIWIAVRLNRARRALHQPRR
jgi:hypothetical protein